MWLYSNYPIITRSYLWIIFHSSIYNVVLLLYKQANYRLARTVPLSLRQGDIILKVAGIETNSVADLRSTIDAQPVGSKKDLIITRNGQTMTIKVTFEEMPAGQ